VSKILYLRQQYHFGPGRIAAYLATLPPSGDCLFLGASDSRQALHEPAASESKAPATPQALETV
jgi:hypothetical protein